MGLLKNKYYTSSESLSALAWKRFKKNKLAMASLIFIVITCVISILGYLITPDKSPFANEQHLEITVKKPFFNVDFLSIKKYGSQKKNSILKKMFYGEQNNYTSIPFYSYQIKGDYIEYETFTGEEPNNGTIHRLHLCEINEQIKDVSSIVLKNGFYEVGNKKINKKELIKEIKENNISTKKYFLGTDRFGRDLLSRLLIGTRVSLSVGFISVIISLIVGISIGAIAGYFRSWIDDVIIWFINVIWSIPTVLLVIAITFALGKGFWQIFVAVGLSMWVEIARVVRGQVISMREKEFVEAGKALGFRNFRIIFKHILPNVLSPVIVISAANFASAILVEAGLSFLGIGVQPPMPSWGSMIQEHRAFIILDSAFLAIIPGIAIMLMVLSFMLLGNGLRDALDVKTND